MSGLIGSIKSAVGKLFGNPLSSGGDPLDSKGTKTTLGSEVKKSFKEAKTENSDLTRLQH